jgi:hypothetical protein
VKLDGVELLLLAINRASVITKSEMFTLLHNYLVERRKS